ncbi:60s acidic ribosomal protein-domain-containing protein [Globomyces pollinis-pini]|nr:60s acidic ribosomal protein-domain-containing protein [Globomyces pollinis-pini]KAJ2993509.1 60S acidic ribosomal protein P1 [Globomyces sp. JEL0801]
MSLSLNEAACVYAALILQDEGLEITADKLTSLISAAGLEVEPIWPSIFAKALAGKDLGALLFNVGAAGGAAPVAGAAAAGAPAAAAEAVAEEKEEEKEESDDDMGFGLFD